MPEKGKPYKVYRGGRVKGPVRAAPPRERPRLGRDGDGYREPLAEPRKERRWRRRMLLIAGVLFVLVLSWTVLGYLAFRSGVKDANERLNPSAERALAPPEGSIVSSPRNLLLLGADVGESVRRSGRGRSDSIMLVRTDPDEDRIAYVSLPRDLRVDIPGRGADKINAAYALGGPALAIDTVEQLTGLPINHVVVVDFDGFKDAIDAVGGITVNVRRPILSNKFECPLGSTARCARWEGWRFRAGRQEMDGRRALVYARIRVNRLNPNESDITRGERQQHVIQALADKVAGPSGFLRMPLIGDDLVEPLATDLSAGEILGLGWVKFRAADDKTLRCRLGGDPVTGPGVSYLQSSEDNALVIAMITGRSAPQRPPAGQPFAPGCFVGRAPS
ncbi:MAG: LCP family protein [Actinomycetota bacterium]|nr:LCP family protein [Actinomycetota bacterium]